MDARALFFVKAEQLSLFDTPANISGYTRRDGTFVKPHVARRRARSDAATGKSREDRHTQLVVQFERDGALRARSKQDPAREILVTRNMSNRDTPYRVTYFTDGKPTGHADYGHLTGGGPINSALSALAGYEVAPGVADEDPDAREPRAHGSAVIDRLRENVKLLAAEQGRTEVQIITALQTSAALTGNEQLLDLLAGLKWELIR